MDSTGAQSACIPQEFQMHRLVQYCALLYLQVGGPSRWFPPVEVLDHSERFAVRLANFYYLGSRALPPAAGSVEVVWEDGGRRQRVCRGVVHYSKNGIDINTSLPVVLLL